MNESLSPAYLTAWRQWHDELEEQRRDPYGYLSFSAVHPLDVSPERFPGVPGAWSLEQDHPVVTLDRGESITIDGLPVTGRHAFDPVRERTEYRHAARHNELVLELSKRGGQTLLRPLDPRLGLREQYVETPCFAPSASWVVDGQFAPFPEPRDQRIDTAISGIVHSYPAVGDVVFTAAGSEQRLLVFSPDLAAFTAGPVSPGITFFTDATGGVTTEPDTRALAIRLPTGGGPVVIDFNRAYNMECAYTPYSPCSLAPQQNRLGIAITAGEQSPIIRA